MYHGNGERARWDNVDVRAAANQAAAGADHAAQVAAMYRRWAGEFWQKAREAEEAASALARLAKPEEGYGVLPAEPEGGYDLLPE